MSTVWFAIVATIAVLGALGVVCATKAVYSALCLATTMIVLAICYIAQGAVFLGVVQVVVYTGAVMMLFLFVVMLIGIDSSDSLVETLRGQRLAAALVGAGFGILLISGIGGAITTTGPEPAAGGVAGLAELVFVRYVWAFELTGGLLITATLGAMLLAHRERLEPRKDQREMSIERFRDGGQVTPLPSPGVYARHNAVDMPARLADGGYAAGSISSVLTPRDPEGRSE